MRDDVENLFIFVFKLVYVIVGLGQLWKTNMKIAEITLISLKITSCLKRISGNWDIWYTKKENININDIYFK